MISLEEYLPLHIAAYLEIAKKDNEKVDLLPAYEENSNVFYFNFKTSSEKEKSIDEWLEEVNSKGHSSRLLLQPMEEEFNDYEQYILTHGTRKEIEFFFSYVEPIDAEEGHQILTQERKQYNSLIEALSKHKDGKDILYNYLKSQRIHEKSPVIQHSIKKSIMSHFLKDYVDFNHLFNNVIEVGSIKEVISYLTEKEINFYLTKINRQEEDIELDISKLNYWIKELIKRNDMVELLNEYFKTIKINEQKEKIQIEARDIVLEYFPTESHLFNYFELLKKDDKPIFTERELRSTMFEIDYAELQKQYPIKEAQIIFYKESLFDLFEIMNTYENLGITHVVEIPNKKDESKSVVTLVTTLESNITNKKLKQLIIDFTQQYIMNFDMEDIKFRKSLYAGSSLDEDLISKEGIKEWLDNYFFRNQLEDGLEMNISVPKKKI